MYIYRVIVDIFKVLDFSDRRNYLILQLFFVVSAVLQVIGVASIAPFISVLTNQDIIHNNSILSLFYQLGNFKSDISFISVLALVSLAMIVVSNLAGALTIWLTFKLSVKQGSKLQRKVYESYLCRGYIYHKNKNYNVMVALISQQIPRFVYMVFQPFLLLTSNLLVAILIIGGLIYLDPFLAVISAVLVGGAYACTFVSLRKSLLKKGEDVTYRNEKIQSLISESFIGIKDIKLGGSEHLYVDEFEKVNKKGLLSQAFIALSGEIPRFVIETLSFGAILVLALVLIHKDKGLEGIVPILSLYALAGYKLLPTMQQIYKSLSSLSGHGEVGARIYSELSEEIETPNKVAQNLPLVINSILAKNLWFSYPGSSVPAVKDVSFSLKKGVMYSLAGPSGSGKSTLADILLGLLDVQHGEIFVNGKLLDNENLALFRKSVSYVPQDVFILEDTVVNNVAFGNVDREIDVARIEWALKMANAWEFVCSLPRGLHTNLGQDGKLLSGGQRQRIGIARALYKECDVIVMDEPTSALDLESEFRLLNELKRIKEQFIILIVSHRIASIKASDEIILMKDGGIVNAGTLTELVESNRDFANIMSREVSSPI